MTSILPKSGASYEWPRQFVSPCVGFMVAWLRILASVGVLVTLALVFVQYLATVLVLPTRPTMICLLLIVLCVNLRGIHISARAQSAAMLLLVTTLCGFVCFSARSVRLDRIGNPFIHGAGPILAAVPVMISLYLGIETDGVRAIIDVQPIDDVPDVNGAIVIGGLRAQQRMPRFDTPCPMCRRFTPI